jgi:hypothetical protein
MDTLAIGTRRREHTGGRGCFIPRGFVIFMIILALDGCSGGDGDSSQPPLDLSAQEASISLTAYPPAVQSGESATISWQAQNLDSCKATGGWSGNKSTEGTETVGPLTETTVFTLECETTSRFSTLSCKTADGCKGRGPDQRKKKSGTVIVDGQAPAPSPTVSLEAAPTSVTGGDFSTLTWWSTDADRCDASLDWSGRKATSGNEDVGPLAATSEFALTCSNTGGDTTQSAVVNVDAAPPPPVPTVSLTANPTSVAYNGSTTLSWLSSDATSCFGEDAWSGDKPLSGSETVSGLTISSTFGLTCIGDGGSASQAVTVLVQAPIASADLSWVAPASNEDGSPVTITAFNIYAGTSATSLLKIATVNGSQTSFTVNGLPTGTTYFAVTAVSDTGAESVFSNIGSKTI